MKDDDTKLKYMWVDSQAANSIPASVGIVCACKESCVSNRKVTARHLKYAK